MDVDLSILPENVRERWPLAVERAARKAASVVPNLYANKLLQVSQKAATASQRVMWLQRAASAWGRPLDAVAACRKGCAHCCHIPVTISSVEADLIGRHTGHEAKSPADVVRIDALRDPASALPTLQAISNRRNGEACPFLVEQSCSIYEVRPMACRLLLNLDDDDLLCRLVDGVEIPVPYANSGQLKTLFLMAQASSQLADIRDFFPVSAELEHCRASQ
jgi:hypothetical protein